MSTTYAGPRITIERVRSAYEKTGLKPARELYADGRCGCPLGACVVAISPFIDPDSIDENIAASTLGLNVQYATGFANGFDGYMASRTSNDAYLAGHQDGSAAAAEVFAEEGTD